MKFFKLNTEVVRRILFVGIGAAIGILATAMYSRFVSSPLGAIVIINVIAFVLIYIYLNLRYHKRQELLLQGLLRAIEDIQEKNGQELKPPFSGAAPVYNAIGNLRKALWANEANRAEILSLVNSVAANMELEALLEALMPKLIDASRSNWGAFYLANNATGKLEIKSSVGFSKNIYSDFDVNLGEGFIGQAAQSRETRIITDIPDDTIFVTRTFLGRVKPKNLMIVPIVNQDQLMGVLALASLYDFTDEQLEIVNLIKFYIGAAVGNGVIFERTKRLTNELQFQNRLIQDLNNELEAKMNDASVFLNHIINSITDYAIYSMDMRGVIVTWNKGAELIYGYTANEIVGKHVSLIYNAVELSGETLDQRTETVRREGRIVETGWRAKKDGTLYYADVVVFAMYNENGKQIGMTSVSKDITELKRAQNQLLLEKELTYTLIRESRRAIALINEDGSVELANKRMCEAFAAASLTGANFFALFTDEIEAQRFILEGDPAKQHTLRTKTTGDDVTVTATAIDDAESHLSRRVFVLLSDTSVQ